MGATETIAAAAGAKQAERARILKEIDKQISICKDSGSLSALRSLALWIESDGFTTHRLESEKV